MSDQCQWTFHFFFLRIQWPFQMDGNFVSVIPTNIMKKVFHQKKKKKEKEKG